MANHRNVILAGKSKGTTPALLSFMALQHFISIEEYSLANGALPMEGKSYIFKITEIRESV